MRGQPDAVQPAAALSDPYAPLEATPWCQSCQQASRLDRALSDADVEGDHYACDSCGQRWRVLRPGGSQLPVPYAVLKRDRRQAPR